MIVIIAISSIYFPKKKFSDDSGYYNFGQIIIIMINKTEILNISSEK